MKRLILLAAAAALSGCATTSSASGADVGTVGIGRTASVNGLRVRPLSVVEDSRCPMNARCVWAGRIIVRVALSGQGPRTTRNLTLGEPVEHNGGRLALVSAEPSRMAGGPATPARNYRFAFTYER